MPSRYERAVSLTLDSPSLAVVPAVATLLSFSNVARVLVAGPGGGVSFPFPHGLPTLWTYVSVPSGSSGVSLGGPLSLVTFLPLFVLGLLLTSALEAGFLGSLSRHIDAGAHTGTDRRPVAPLPVFVESARRFTLRLVGVNLIRAGIVLAVFPLLFLPPLAFVAVLALSYLTYGLPFVVVAGDVTVRTALGVTWVLALDGGSYASFGVAHLVCGAAVSLVLTWAVRNVGVPGILVGTVLTAMPAVFVAAYGLLLVRDAGVGQHPSE
jgi:hypothetical protein